MSVRRALEPCSFSVAAAVKSPMHEGLKLRAAQCIRLCFCDPEPQVPHQIPHRMLALRAVVNAEAGSHLISDLSVSLPSPQVLLQSCASNVLINDHRHGACRQTELFASHSALADLLQSQCHESSSTVQRQQYSPAKLLRSPLQGTPLYSCQG